MFIFVEFGLKMLTVEVQIKLYLEDLKTFHTWKGVTSFVEEDNRIIYLYSAITALGKYYCLSRMGLSRIFFEACGMPQVRIELHS